MKVNPLFFLRSRFRNKPEMMSQRTFEKILNSFLYIFVISQPK